MPLSKRRKKKGKKVRKNSGTVTIDPNKESSISLQDLINVLAFQESKKPDDDPTKMVKPDVGINHYEGDIIEGEVQDG